MKAGGDHAADPITTKMLADLRRAEISDRLTKQAAEDDGGEVDLSLGLSIGGGNKRKAGAGVYLNGSVGNSADPNRKCRARVEGEAKEEEVGGLRFSDVRTQSPEVESILVVPMCMPVAGGSKFPCMVSCCTPPPPLVSDSGGSFLSSISCRSLPPFAAANINHCPNPNRSREIGGKSSAMIKRGPSSSASPVRSYSGPLRGRSGSSSESRSNSTNLGAAAEKPKEQANQEVMSKPRVQSQAAPEPALAKVDQMPCVMAKGADGKAVSGFLYCYEEEEEVSIVCVCHGSCFSPAGFVRHAGGAESSHPLRQITVVVPS